MGGGGVVEQTVSFMVENSVKAILSIVDEWPSCVREEAKMNYGSWENGEE